MDIYNYSSSLLSLQIKNHTKVVFLLIVLLIAHILGDFFFQSPSLSDKKKESYPYVMLHSAIYAAPALLFFCFKLEWSLLWVALIYIFAHFTIDSFKFKIETEDNVDWVFVIDQILHLINLFILAVSFKDLSLYPKMVAFVSSLGSELNVIIKTVLLVLIALKPTNIIYKNVFFNLKPVLDESNELKKGAVIGSLERLLILYLLIAGQFTAIGLVVTGKSIARYNKIVEEKEFAEYYLIGTFYSILSVLVPFLVFW